jgi:large subunit ribosomal protein L18
MNIAKKKIITKTRRKAKIRVKIRGTAVRPRLNVFRSNTNIYAQIINDDQGITLVSAHTKEIKLAGKKSEICFELGKALAKKALDKKIKQAVFDRGGYKYHGRVKAVAEGARESGLKI